MERTGHQREACIAEVLARAESLCNQRGSRFTDIRRNVLRLVWADHKAVKAYDLIERLGAANAATVKPPTVYRALDFLIEHGFVHKIESLNAYIGCPHAGDEHLSQFLICDRCGDVWEVAMVAVRTALLAAAAAENFHISRQMVEIHGLCAACQA